MSNETKCRFELTQAQRKTIREQTGVKAETLELTVEKLEDSVAPRGFRLF